MAMAARFTASQAARQAYELPAPPAFQCTATDANTRILAAAISYLCKIGKEISIEIAENGVGKQGRSGGLHGSTVVCRAIWSRPVVAALTNYFSALLPRHTLECRRWPYAP